MNNQIRVESLEKRFLGERAEWVATGDLPMQLPGGARIRASFALGEEAGSLARAIFLTGQAPYLVLVKADNPKLNGAGEEVSEDQIVGFDYVI